MWNYPEGECSKKWIAISTLIFRLSGSFGDALICSFVWFPTFVILADWQVCVCVCVLFFSSLVQTRQIALLGWSETPSHTHTHWHINHANTPFAWSHLNKHAFSFLLADRSKRCLIPFHWTSTHVNRGKLGQVCLAVAANEKPTKEVHLPLEIIRQA